MFEHVEPGIVSPFLTGKLHRRLLCAINNHSKHRLLPAAAASFLCVNLTKTKGDAVLTLTWLFLSTSPTCGTAMLPAQDAGLFPAGLALRCCLPLHACVVTNLYFLHSSPFFPFSSYPAFGPNPWSAAGGNHHPLFSSFALLLKGKWPLGIQMLWEAHFVPIPLRN